LTFRHRQSDEAKQFTRGRQLNSPVDPTLRSKLRQPQVNASVGLLWCLQGREVAHHLGVKIHLRIRLAMAVFPDAKGEARVVEFEGVGKACGRSELPRITGVKSSEQSAS
jgi:hypothetical protein